MSIMQLHLQYISCIPMAKRKLSSHYSVVVDSQIIRLSVHLAISLVGLCNCQPHRVWGACDPFCDLACGHIQLHPVGSEKN